MVWVRPVVPATDQMAADRSAQALSARSHAEKRVISPRAPALRACTRLNSSAILGITILSLALGAAPTQAAVTHEFEKPISEALEKGVPPEAAEALLTGALSGVSSLTSDSEEHLWVAERIEKGKHEGESRADQFDLKKEGKFVPAQIERVQEEGGVTGLEHGVAVGRAGGEEEIYIGAAHKLAGAVATFGSSRKLQAVWSGLNTPGKAFGEVAGVAVDASGNLETHGDVYVATRGLGSTNVVDVYPGEAGGKEPILIGQLTGIPPGTTACPGKTPCPFVNPEGVAVSPANGDVLVADGNPGRCPSGKGECGIDVFEPVPGMPGKYTFLFKIEGPGASEPFGFIGPVAADSQGDIYVVDIATKVLDQFNAAGKLVGRLSGTAPASPFKGLRSIAVEAGGKGRLFLGDFDSSQKTGKVDVFSHSLVVPDVKTEPPSAIKVRTEGPLSEGRIEATLNGSVNPLNEGTASCQFLWGETEAFGHLASCDAPIANGSSPVAVKAKIEGLAPDSSYTFRLQATNKNGTNPGEASQNKEFSTPGPGIHSASAAEITPSSAALNASIDPNNAPTSYYFQYGKSATYEAEAPAAPGTSIGAGKGDVQVTPQKIEGLAPSSTYHFRVVAVSTLEVEGKPSAVSFDGPDQTFTTRPSSSGPLLDGRRWELVSPQNKHGALFQGIAETGVIQASTSGNSISYVASQPSEEEVKGNIFEGVQLLSGRGETSWSTEDIALPHASVVPYPANFGKEYRFFSSDLSRALAEPLGEFTSLSPEVFPPDSERGPYIRHDATCKAEPGSCYEPLLLGCPAKPAPCPPLVEENADVPAGTKFGGNPAENGQGRFFGQAGFIGASEDLTHVIVGGSGLTKTPTEGKRELYEWSAQKSPTERLELVSVLPPNGKGEVKPGEGVLVGSGTKTARTAVSADGSRVVWSATVEGEQHLYLRDIAKGQTVQLDVPEAACVEHEECEAGPAPPRFQLASPDGSRILFTDTQRLSSNASKAVGKADLYECKIAEVAGKLECQLSDLTPSPGPGQAADVQGDLLGTSEDGAWVYFVANGVLGDAGAHGASPGNCEVEVKGGDVEGSGSCQLYVEHEGTTHLIATLTGADYPSWAGLGGTLNDLTARVSPDGQWLAFMSQLPLTGYDNRDAASGKPDEEVFLYHASGEGSLACASCNPSGARPEGVEYAKINDLLAGGDFVWNNKTWIAANVPGWTPYELADARHQSRYLSNSGRLFFNTSDALVSQDKNKNQDVYEYEPAGAGDCSSASVAYNPAQEACLALISSGEAKGESAFLDASENGNDVFFLTPQSLVSKDIDTAIDVYDAHVCSAEAPCAEEPPPPIVCENEERCHPAPKEASIFAPPASESFQGSGNIHQPPPAAPHVESAHEKLLKALSSCRKKYKGKGKKTKKRRASCEAQAHKRYDPTHAKKSAKKKPKKKAKRR